MIEIKRMDVHAFCPPQNCSHRLELISNFTKSHLTTYYHFYYACPFAAYQKQQNSKTSYSSCMHVLAVCVTNTKDKDFLYLQRRSTI